MGWELANLLSRLLRDTKLTQQRLADLVGVEPLTVGRWARGTNQPTEAHFVALMHVLDEAHRACGRTLSAADRAALKAAVGHRPVLDVSGVADRCIVYSYRYAPTKFPDWYSHIAAVEHDHPQHNLDVMIVDAPAASRPAAYYHEKFARSRGGFDSAAIDGFLATHRRRQQCYEERLATTFVRHLYNGDYIRRYFTGQPTKPSDAAIPMWVRREQAETIWRWLTRYNNFDLRLTSHHIPAHFQVLHHPSDPAGIVLLELNQDFEFLPQDNVMGFHFTGTDTTSQFLSQFQGLFGRESARSRLDMLNLFRSYANDR
jgi:hypothetical protein